MILKTVMRYLGLDFSTEGSETHVLVERLLRRRGRYNALGTSITELEAELSKRGVSVDPNQPTLF